MILLDLRSAGISGAKGEKILEEIGIACNKNTGIIFYSAYEFILRLRKPIIIVIRNLGIHRGLEESREN